MLRRTMSTMFTTPSSDATISTGDMPNTKRPPRAIVGRFARLGERVTHANVRRQSEGAMPILLHLQSALGIAVIILVAWLLSENRRAFPWRTVIVGIAIQAVLA